MSVVVSSELQELFNLRDRRAAAIESFILAEAELQGNMQQNVVREFVGLDDLEITYQLLSPVSAAKDELEAINTELERKKKFFIALLEASGCAKLHCFNKETNEHDQVEDVPYVLALSKNTHGETDLLIQHQVVVQRHSAL